MPAQAAVVVHFPAPVVTSAGMSDVREILASFAPGMLLEVVFVDEGLACGNTEIFTVSAVSSFKLDVVGVSGTRYGIVAYGDNTLTFGRSAHAVRPINILAVRTVANTPA